MGFLFCGTHCIDAYSGGLCSRCSIRMACELIKIEDVYKWLPQFQAKWSVKRAVSCMLLANADASRRKYLWQGTNKTPPTPAFHTSPTITGWAGMPWKVVAPSWENIGMPLHACTRKRILHTHTALPCLPQVIVSSPQSPLIGAGVTYNRALRFQLSTIAPLLSSIVHLINPSDHCS